MPDKPGYFIFNGVNSRDFDIVIESYPTISRGLRRGEVYQIAGANGSRVTEDGTFDNYTQTFQISVKEGPARPASLRGADLARWLLNSRGYCRLESSFELEHFRFARFAGPLNLEQIMGRWGRCALEFDCQPERYLIDGEKAIDGRALILDGKPFLLINPTGFEARPLLRIGGSGSVFVTFENGDDELKIGINLGTGALVEIDSADYSAWKLISTTERERADNLLTFYDDYHTFPTLKAGTTEVTPGVSTGASILQLEVIPRWWTA